MIDIKKTIAGKWFLNYNNFDVAISAIPKKIIDDLSVLTENEIEELSFDIIGVFLEKLRTNYNRNISFDEYVKIYKEMYFPVLKTDDIIGIYINKLKNLLLILVMSNDKYLNIESTYSLINIVNYQISLLISKSPKNNFNNLKENKITYKEILLEAFNKGDFELVDNFLNDYKSYL